MNPLDAEQWEGPPAPEGSPERREARWRLYTMARRQIHTLGRSEDEWLEGVRREAPQLCGAVGEEDLERIAHLARTMA